MDFSKIPGKIFIGEDFIKSEKAQIHVLSHSLHFASSVFEGIRIYKSNPFCLKTHINRLENSCQLMGLSLPYTKTQIIDICLELIKVNSLEDGYLRPLVFRDAQSMSPETINCKTILCVAGWKWNKLFKQKASIGLDLSSWKKPNCKIIPVQAKSSGSYQSATIAKNFALNKGFDDTLMLDLNDNVAESSACNIFWTKNGQVFTPDIHSILNGITRQIIIKLLKQNNINVSISDYKIEHLLKADEVFLTGTAAEIINVNGVENNKFQNSELTKILIKEYELAKQKPESDIL